MKSTFSPLLLTNFSFFSFQHLSGDQRKAIGILRAVAGLPARQRFDDLLNPDGTFKYVITVDNLLKMLSILMRLRCGIPTIIMVCRDLCCTSFVPRSHCISPVRARLGVAKVS